MRDVHVIVVTTGVEERYWAAAVPREQAVAAVLRVAPPDSQAALTDYQLTSDQLAALELGPNAVRELGYMP